MSNFFYCCSSEGLMGSLEKLNQQESVLIEKMNGHRDSNSCPFSEEPVDMKTENGFHKALKPNLRIKVPTPIRLKNHLVQEENMDNLHSSMDNNVTSHVGTLDSCNNIL